MTKVKNFALVVCLAFLATSALAQQETLFGKSRVVGAFGAPIFEFGLNNDLNPSTGFGGALVINSFFLGAYGMGAADFKQLIEDNNDIDKLDLAHGGLWLGFAVPSYRLVHIYGSARLGWGAVNVELDDPGLEYEDLDHVFVFTPELGVELNVTRWFRVAGSVGYRFLDGANSNLGYSDKDFRGALAGLTLRFGGFGRHRSNDRWHDDD